MGDPRHTTANGIEFAYLDAGPADGPLALCLHGFPDHAPTWRHLLPALAAAGWHAVAPWMRGYHPTGAAPDGRYQSACLALDAVALIEALGAPARPAVVVGHDWGALAALGTGIMAPGRIARVASLALPHPAISAARLLGDWEQRKRSWYMWFFQTPVLPEMALAADDFAFIDRLWAEWSPGLAPDPEDMRRLKDSLGAPGVAEAAVEYYRQTVDVRRQSDELADLQREVSFGRIPVPALFLAGRDDGCMAAEYVLESGSMCDAECTTLVLDGCGHFLHLERPAQVNRLILDFLAPVLE